MSLRRNDSMPLLRPVHGLDPVRLPAGLLGAKIGLVIACAAIIASIGLSADLAINAHRYASCSYHITENCDTDGLYLHGTIAILLFIGGYVLASSLCGLCVCSGPICRPYRIVSYILFAVWMGLATAGFAIACLQQTGTVDVHSSKWRITVGAASAISVLSLIILIVDSLISIRVAVITGGAERRDTIQDFGVEPRFDPFTGKPLAENQKFRYDPYTGDAV